MPRLDLEKAADRQDTDQQCKATLSIERALLRLIAGERFVGGFDIRDLHIRHFVLDIRGYFLLAKTGRSLDCNHIRGGFHQG